MSAKVRADERVGARVDHVQLHVESRRGRRRPQALPRLVRDAWVMCWRAGRRDFLVTLVPQFAVAGLLALLVPLVRSLLGVLLVQTTEADRLPRAAVPLVLVTALGLVVGIGSTLQGQRAKILGELVQRHVWGRILDVTGRAELAHYDSPDFFDHLQRVQLNAVTRPLTVVQGVTSIAGGVVGVGAVTVALWTVQPVALVLLLPVPVLLLLARKGGREDFDFVVGHTATLRLRDYLRASLTERRTASEVRSYGLQQELRNRYETLYDGWVEAIRRHTARRRRTLLLGELLTAVVTIGLLVLLVGFIDDGRLSLEQAGAVGVAVPLLANRLRQFVRGVGSVLESGPFLDDLAVFCATPFEVPAVAGTTVEPLVALTTHDLAFAYPSGAEVLQGIDLEVRRGEVVALVGENGSGKTTLAKLLSAVYRPTSGTVRWNGEPVERFAPEVVRRRIAVLFQDFVRWQFSGRDNIALGDVRRRDPVQDAARRAGALGFLEELPNGLDTPLSTERPGGTDLSGGQWQRVALARAVYRDADLLVLDEPSASLDARAEAELFETVRATSRGRAVVLITHRLANVRTVDRIYVLRAGRVDDCGTHEELLARGGHYAELYGLQVKAYWEENSSETIPRGRHL